MRSQDAAKRWCRGIGTEIGAFKCPIPGIKPIYVDKFEKYANEPTRAAYFGEATDLPFADESLDYVASSHVLEHTANPVKALCEWHRVLKRKGIVYMVVPDKQFTFDCPRKTTVVDHMIDDYLNNVDDTDPTHIEDFVYGVEWSEFAPSDTSDKSKENQDELAQSYRLATERKEIINIHFHVFTKDSLLDLIKSVNQDDRVPCRWAIEATVTRFPDEIPNGILVVLRKKAPKLRLSLFKQTREKRLHPNFPLLKSARAFTHKSTNSV
jgi:ribosomal protein L36